MKNDLFVDLDWLHRVSHTLDRFKRVSARKNVYTCRCPVCGDSKKSAKKTRFFFYEKKGQLNCMCYNCSYSSTFYNFMKDVVETSFEDYKKEQLAARFKQSAHRPSSAGNTLQSVNDDVELTSVAGEIPGTVPILSLPEDHMALRYMASRGFDKDCLSRMLFANDFSIPFDAICPNGLPEKFPSEPRIVIPFYNKDGTVKAIQGRSLNPKSKMKYITVKADDNADKIYGLDIIDNSKTVYCVEGPLDSLFIDNCVATCDASLTKAKADVYIWDNEPRKKETVAYIDSAIDQGYSVVIWPTSPNKKMDINDMILLGMTKQDLMAIIKLRTFSGIRAKLELNKWKKV